MDPRVEKIYAAAEFIREKIGGRKPVAGIILGSGLGKLGEKIENPVVIPYRTIQGFPVSTAIGHKGNFIAGELGGKFIIAMQGRFHYYEGYPMELITLPVRVMRTLGIDYLFVSNAAGGGNPDYEVGDPMIVNCINYAPISVIGGRAGGICGSNSGEGLILNCVNTAPVSGSGICGSSANGPRIEICFNCGKPSSGYGVGHR